MKNAPISKHEDAPNFRITVSKQRRRFCAVDTSFLLALAAGDGDCETVVDWLSTINMYPLVTPTVLQELVDLEDCRNSTSEVAEQAKRCLSTWGFLAPQMEGTDHGIAEIIARKLVEKGVLADECVNDGLVIAEAAMQECTMIITFRETILGSPVEEMKLVLLESDVCDLFAVSPEHIVDYLQKR